MFELWSELNPGWSDEQLYQASISNKINKLKMIKEAIWEENKFDIEIITDSEIESFNFNWKCHQQTESKSISLFHNDSFKISF